MITPRTRKEIDVAMGANNATYIDYLDRLRLLSTSIFSWKNLDKVAGFGAERFLEQALYDNGRACFVRDPELGFMVLKANPSDKLNIYQLPVKIEAWSIGYNKQYKFDDVAYIMNNVLQKPTLSTIMLIAYRLYETERTIDVNLMAQKTPVLIQGDTKTILTLKQVYEQYSGNTPFIFGNKQFDVSNKLSAIKTDAPYIIDKLTQHKKDLMTEALNFLGIDNFFSDKKERLITAEAEGTEALTNFYLNCFYKTRQEAVEIINEKFLSDSDTKIELSVNREEIAKLKDELDDIMEREDKDE
ncbi:MAG: hypothetical protein IKY26_02855 [Erysipelotrichaceae bacterium]|nr:hypothetical protein [Erysipelotrichaceae bacterium]